MDGLGNSRSCTLLCPRLARPALLRDPPRVGAEVVAIRAPGYCRAQNLHVFSRDACARSPSWNERAAPGAPRLDRCCGGWGERWSGGGLTSSQPGARAASICSAEGMDFHESGDPKRTTIFRFVPTLWGPTCDTGRSGYVFPDSDRLARISVDGVAASRTETCRF